MEQVFVHAAPDGTPLAGSGHSAWAGLVADIGVLTAPDARRGGLGRLLAGIAVNDALDSGLVPVWRARRGSAVSERLAQRLGFVPFGAQTTVAVPGR
nr:GNAT family N-acetyltransferase [Auraticoccus cholistanensis]